MPSQEKNYVHAPTFAVSFLRQAALVIREAAKVLPDELIYFPPKEGEESQPIYLVGDVPLSTIADLADYLADMLEV